MGRVLWKMDRRHPVYGEEGAELCVNEENELLVVAYDTEEQSSSTLTREDATGLRDALTAWLGEPQ
jgi:hypothetical protein